MRCVGAEEEDGVLCNRCREGGYQVRTNSTRLGGRGGASLAKAAALPAWLLVEEELTASLSTVCVRRVSARKARLSQGGRDGCLSRTDAADPQQRPQLHRSRSASPKHPGSDPTHRPLSDPLAPNDSFAVPRSPTSPAHYPPLPVPTRALGAPRVGGGALRRFASGASSRALRHWRHQSRFESVRFLSSLSSRGR